MPSTRDLMNAIYASDLDRVQEILSVRDERGVPKLDLNQGFDLNKPSGECSFINGTALLFCVRVIPVNEQIFQALLDVRDKQQNLVINPNYTLRDDTTIVDKVLGVESASTRRRLLQRLIDHRDHNGEPCVDFSSNKPCFSRLEIALWQNDPETIRMLLGIRDRARNRALDVNRITFGETVLDKALDDDALCYIRNEEIIAMIERAGGVRAQDLRHQEVLPRRRVVAEMGRDTPDDEFTNNPQNTHSTEVTVSVAASIAKLKARYSEINVIETLKPIRAYLTELPRSNNKKQYAINCLDRIERDPTRHALCNETTLPQALALIWIGIHDKSALVKDVEELTDNDIECRKLTLVDNLYLAQTEYGTGRGDEACFVGTLNKIIETLDRAHPDVTIITGRSNILPTATQRARIIAHDELKKKTPQEQNLEKFIELDTLIQRILLLPNDNQNEQKNTVFAVLKQEAKKSYLVRDETFDERCTELQVALHKFNNLSEFLDRLHDLTTQTNDLRKRNHHDTANVADHLATDLQRTAITYIADSKADAYSTFKINCSRYIKAAESVLTHRDWFGSPEAGWVNEAVNENLLFFSETRFGKILHNLAKTLPKIESTTREHTIQQATQSLKLTI